MRLVIPGGARGLNTKTFRGVIVRPHGGRMIRWKSVTHLEASIPPGMASRECDPTGGKRSSGNGVTRPLGRRAPVRPPSGLRATSALCGVVCGPLCGPPREPLRGDTPVPRYIGEPRTQVHKEKSRTLVPRYTQRRKYHGQPHTPVYTEKEDRGTPVHINHLNKRR